jgi:hypothetical protein
MLSSVCTVLQGDFSTKVVVHIVRVCFVPCYCRITCSYALCAEDGAPATDTFDNSSEGAGNAMNFYHPATGQRLLSVTDLHDTYVTRLFGAVPLGQSCALLCVSELL